MRYSPADRSKLIRPLEVNGFSSESETRESRACEDGAAARVAARIADATITRM